MGERRDRTGSAVPRRGAGELEGEVLGTLWSAGAPMTPARLHAALGGDLAYNTVHTILTRLCDKSLVRRTVVDGRPAYAPVHEAAEWSAAQMRAVLDRGRDRGAILQHFVTSLSEADERVLRDLLSAEAGAEAAAHPDAAP
jgi:predicted transcriptional regulator